MICIATVSVCTFNRSNNQKFIIMYFYGQSVSNILASYGVCQYIYSLQQILLKETK